jgi:hypothetical protein
MGANTQPTPNNDPSSAPDTKIDPMGVSMPPDIRERLIGFGAVACQVSADHEEIEVSLLIDGPSGLLGTDDDRGLYRHGRSIRL